MLFVAKRNQRSIPVRVTLEERRTAALPLSLLVLSLLAAHANAQQSVPPPAPLPLTPPAAPLPLTPPPASAPSLYPAAPLGNPDAAYPPNIPPPLPADAVKGGGAAKDAALQKAHINMAERLLGKWGRGLTITGGASLRMQNNTVNGANDGARSFYDSNNNNLDYRTSANGMQHSADMTIQGKVLNAFDVNARLSTSRYGNRFDQVFAFNYANKDKTTKFELGNVNASLPGNQFVTFSRSLTGVSGSRDFGKGKVKGTGVASLTRSLTRRGSFTGKGISGPYFLNASSLVEGSEKVQLNGKGMEPGVDYRIDYLLGQITFLGSRIVNPEDTVVFTYESYAYNTTPGLLTGTRWDFNDSKQNSYGVTFLRQSTTGARVRDGEVTERFPVIADLRYKYQLSSAINVAFPVYVRWNNRQLVENVDYVLNKELRYFQLLTSSLPADTSLTGNVSLAAVYHPVRTYSLAGDRNVLGLDGRYKITQNGSVSVQMGNSSGQDAKQNGTALDLSTSWQAPGVGTKNRWTLTAGFRNIEDTFSTIDSTAAAFLNAERGMRVGFNYIFDPHINLTSNFSRSQIATRQSTLTTTTGTTTPLIYQGSNSYDIGLNVNLPRLPAMRLERRQTVQDSSGSANRFESTSLTAGGAITPKLTLKGELAQTLSHGLSVFSNNYNNNVTNTASGSGSLIDNIQNNSSRTDSSYVSSRLDANYIPTAWLTLNGNVGFSKSDNRAASSSATNSKSNNNARSMGVGATITPLRAMTIAATYDESSNGQSVANFYKPGTGSDSIIPSTNSGQKTRNTGLGITYVPMDSLNVTFNVSHSLSLVPGYDNSDSVNYSFTAGFVPREWLQTSFTLTEQKYAYVGGQGDSNNHTMTMFVSAGPFKRLDLSGTISQSHYGSSLNTVSSSGGNYGLGGNTGSTTTGYQQAGNNLSGQLGVNYDIGGRRLIVTTYQWIDQRSPFSGTDTTSANRAGTDFFKGTSTVGFSLPLNEVLRFNIDFNLISLKDRVDSKYSYRARTFTADLSARF